MAIIVQSGCLKICGERQKTPYSDAQKFASRGRDQSKTEFNLQIGHIEQLQFGQIRGSTSVDTENWDKKVAPVA